MKSTIRTRTVDVLVEPIPHSPEIRLALRAGGIVIGSVQLTPDQVGALEFGMEAALEVHELAAQRMAA